MMKGRRWRSFRNRSSAALGPTLGVLLGCLCAVPLASGAETRAAEQRAAGMEAGSATPQTTDFASAMSSTVIFLYAKEGGDPLGTAFVVGYPAPGKANAVVPLIVTAKHVIADRALVVARFTGRSGSGPVDVAYDLADLRKSGDLWEHSDEGVDVVVFRTRTFPQMQPAWIPVDLVADREGFLQEDVKATDRVVFPSLLVNFAGTSRNYPVVRDGSIALIPDEPIPIQYMVGSKPVSTKQSLILINAASAPGSSGAPVFLWPGPRSKHGDIFIDGTRPLLLGIMHGHFSAGPRLLIEIGPNVSVPASEVSSGIAIAFPSWRLREILERNDVKKRIADLAAKEE